jgi:hypothetical protein
LGPLESYKRNLKVLLKSWRVDIFTIKGLLLVLYLYFSKKHKSPMSKTFLFISFILLISQLALSQTDSLNKKMMEENYRAFDFWIGEWDVYKNGTETVVGHNKIESILGGKAIRETYYSSKSKYEGTSLNKFNPNSQKWEQFWVDNAGLTLHIKGGLVDGKMVLSSEEKTKEGFIENRITWTPNEDGTVRQMWETRTDKQKEWQLSFDGI